MLNALLVENKLDNTLLERALQTTCARTLKTEYGPLSLALVKEFNPDLIVFNLDTPSEQLISDLHKLNQRFTCPIILFVHEASANMIDQVIQTDISAFIVGEIITQRLNSIITIAIARFKQTQALRTALEEARNQLEDRKQIDRAKAILIKTQKFTEDEAYHTLRKLAMDRNITLGKMAKQVIDMAALLK